MTITTLAGVCCFDANSASLFTAMLWDTLKPSHLHFLVRPPRVGLTPALYGCNAESYVRSSQIAHFPQLTSLYEEWLPLVVCNENDEGKEMLRRALEL